MKIFFETSDLFKPNIVPYMPQVRKLTGEQGLDGGVVREKMETRKLGKMCNFFLKGLA